MPAVPLTKTRSDSAHALPPDPNQGAKNAASSSSGVSVQPAPAVVDTTSHETAHVFPRRFLGPMPQRAATSNVAEEKRRLLRNMRRAAMDKLLHEDELGIDDSLGAEARARARRVVHRFRVMHKSSMGDETEVDYELGDSSSGSSSDEGGWGTGSERRPKPDTEARKAKKDAKKKKKKEDAKADKKKGKGGNKKWVGNSFDIGCEYESVPGKGMSDPAIDPGDALPQPEQPSAASILGSEREGSPEVISDEAVLGRDVQDSPVQLGDDAHLEEPGTPTKRGPSAAAQPANVDSFSRASSTRSTGGETFVTARGSPSPNGSDAESTFEAHVPHPAPDLHPPPPPSDGIPTSMNSSPRTGPSSRGDSRARLIHSSDEEADLGESRTSPRPSTSISSKMTGMGRGAKDAFNARLKSAMRPGSTHGYTEFEKPARTKTVQFHHSPDAVITEPTGAQTPAHPKEVLARSGTDVEGTSADATEDAMVIDEDDVLPGGVVMRDRVAVKVGRHRDENIQSFDEMAQRRNPCARIDRMEEFVLAMTVSSIDFYMDWTWPWQERMYGYKRLRYSVPLNAPTTMSVFNKTDMTLALICPWATIVRNTARHLDKSQRKQTSTWDRARHSRIADNLRMNRQGSAIFLITFGERSRALDWHWYIAGQLGVQLPRTVDIRSARLSTTLRMAIPEDPTSAGFNVSSIIGAIWKLLQSNTEQARLIRELGTVPKLQLAWKTTDAMLNWICWNTTVTNRPREWALLASFAEGLAAGSKSTLQVRDASHHGIKVRLEDGTQLEEPPGVEGYLTRHKSDVAPKEELYLCIADGRCFLSSANSATPPLLPRRKGSSPSALFPELHKQFLNEERRRIATFVERSAGCVELSMIESVKLRQPTEITNGIDEPPLEPGEPNLTAQPQEVSESPPHSPEQRARSTSWATRTSQSPQSSSHVPPPEHDAYAGEPPRAKKKRSTSLIPLPKEGTKAEREFEVTLVSGRVIVFEAHTPAIAAEWVARLTELVRYWTMRKHVDARTAMDVVELHMGSELFAAGNSASETLLNQMWNWCVIDGCRPITHSGRVYVRRSQWGKFRSRYLVLTQGSLVAFAFDGRDGMAPRKAVWPLFGSFVYSGMLAEDELDPNSNEIKWDAHNRVYPDGLQSTDGVEDTTFCVRLLWPTGRFAAPQPWDVEANRKEHAKANSKGKGKANGGGNDSNDKAGDTKPSFVPPKLRKEPQRLLICRARSKIERDQWVWALNCEKERFARSHVRDEETLRNCGTLPRHTTLSRTNASAGW